MCRIKNIKLSIVNEDTSSSVRGKNFPRRPLFSKHGESDCDSSDCEDEPLYKSCAVVPNSAALDGAKHGLDIGEFPNTFRAGERN